MNRQQKWRKNTYNGRKITTISNWKTKKLKGDLDEIYETWLNTTHCESCNVELIQDNKSKNRKIMDHHHSSGYFRHIICNTCNGRRQKHDKLMLSLLLEIHRYHFR
jgi:hypothetical protein